MVTTRFLTGWRKRNKELQEKADATAVELQRVVAAIRHEHPAAAATVADAGILLGQIAARLDTDGTYPLR